MKIDNLRQALFYLLILPTLWGLVKLTAIIYNHWYLATLAH